MVASFFCKTTAKEIWKGMTSVSPAGMKRGRGKGTSRVLVKDYNRGQAIGFGKKKMVLPGVNTPVSTGRTVIEIEEVGENPDFKIKIEEARKTMETYKKFRDAPIDRGWSGRKAHGRRAGPPDDHNETSFEGFDSTVLMLRPIFGMSGLLGRTKKMHALVVVGNGNGLAGFADAIGNDPKGAARHARNKAAQCLVKVPLFNNQTVLHDFHSRYYATTVFVERKPEGHGVVAHRIVKAICKAFGIKDLYAKVEGSTTNQINLTKAFFLGLMNQRNYQEMADEKRLHLVEMREENHYYPTVLATPNTGLLSDADMKHDNEYYNFSYYINEGRIKQVKRKSKNPFESKPTWLRHLSKLDYQKNREETKLALAARYGHTRVLDVFPYFRSTAESFKEEN